VTPSAPAGAVRFLVVGSPRSGTTLVQRLACEIPGVAMPPETHFFTRFAVGLLTRHRFPLSGPELTAVVATFAAADAAHGLDVDVEAVVADLGGACGGPLELFTALVRQLAGPADVLGEKTPGHLVWWRPLSQAAPWMRFVVVVRDPRAVVGSSLEMPWRSDPTLPAWGDRMHLVFAALWSFFQGQVPLMQSRLGPDRCLVLRYEDVVVAPDATRARLAAFLGRPVGREPTPAPAGIVLPWESWKAGALGPVGEDRVTAWHEQLAPDRAAEIAALCRTGMRRFGYGDGRPSATEAAVRLARLGPLPLLGLARYGRGRRLHLKTVNGYTL